MLFNTPLINSHKGHCAPRTTEIIKGQEVGGRERLSGARPVKSKGNLVHSGLQYRELFQHLGTKCGRYAGRMVRTGKGGGEGWGWDNLRAGSHRSPQSQEEILIPI